ncbi:peptide-methionine (S)-S-oxide reductase MsrA [Salinibacter grassmerensis]|uniref:peptide-methionine (S)-S-oxide reductase MsrA n=1 Tax=Salinibacter grassmerensis TaxID=3040353 RepID=UPI0021E78B03|nr:peptide-methionine (S)-S-oxide reductase MsrA [Salinibacter grassmerensis]
MVRSFRSLWLIGGLFLVTLIGGFYVSVSGSDATKPSATPAPTISQAVADTATFAGGCFWCMEPPYDKIDGVASTTSGFAGGDEVDPSYREVASGATRHTEVVQVVYDSTTVSYDRLLRVYWHNVDPFDGTGQFCDRGSQYRPAIFAHDAQQRRSAKQSKETVAAQFSREIAVQVQSLDAFYAAEQYHQNYYKKNPADYKRYRQGCGRDARLREIWGDTAMSDAPLDETT